MLHPARTASATFAQKRAKIKVGQIASSAFLMKNQGKTKNLQKYWTSYENIILLLTSKHLSTLQSRSCEEKHADTIATSFLAHALAQEFPRSEHKQVLKDAVRIPLDRLHYTSTSSTER